MTHVWAHGDERLVDRRKTDSVYWVNLFLRNAGSKQQYFSPRGLTICWIAQCRMTSTSLLHSLGCTSSVSTPPLSYLGQYHSSCLHRKGRPRCSRVLVRAKVVEDRCCFGLRRRFRQIGHDALLSKHDAASSSRAVRRTAPLGGHQRSGGGIKQKGFKLSERPCLANYNPLAIYYLTFQTYNSQIYAMAPTAVVDATQSTFEPPKVKQLPLATNVKGNEMDAVSDSVDAVNEYLGKHKDAERPSGAPEQENWKTEKSQFDAEKDKAAFRNYEDAMDHVKVFYKEQHEKQTVEFNLAAREKYLGKVNARMTIWEAIEKLDQLVDESDPDTSLSQIQHLLQTAEAMRRDGKPRWMQLTGLLHDLGKLLVFFGAEGQWDVVGDTFVVGAKFSDKNVYPATFQQNPDYNNPKYNTELGIYSANCGLENIMLSWGHDEYLYHILKDQSNIPEEGLWMVRYHSFYPWHREGAYRQFHDKQTDRDERALQAVLAFNAYDLYSKSDNPPDPVALRPYYEELIDEFFGSRDKIIEW